MALSKTKYKEFEIELEECSSGWHWRAYREGPEVFVADGESRTKSGALRAANAACDLHTPF